MVKCANTIGFIHQCIYLALGKTAEQGLAAEHLQSSGKACSYPGFHCLLPTWFPTPLLDHSRHRGHRPTGALTAPPAQGLSSGSGLTEARQTQDKFHLYPKFAPSTQNKTEPILRKKQTQKSFSSLVLTVFSLPGNWGLQGIRVGSFFWKVSLFAWNPAFLDCQAISLQLHNLSLESVEWTGIFLPVLNLLQFSLQHGQRGRMRTVRSQWGGRAGEEGARAMRESPPSSSAVKCSSPTHSRCMWGKLQPWASCGTIRGEQPHVTLHCT